MNNKYTVRSANLEKYQQCIQMRKTGLSYSEIKSKIDISKSTLQNWLTLSGLTLTNEHLQIQLHKRLEKKDTASVAARITRDTKRNSYIESFINQNYIYFSDQLFIYGIALYEAEGSKQNECRFSNSDFRIIRIFIAFLKKYFKISSSQIKFSLFIHETRKDDQGRIVRFWSDKLQTKIHEFRIYWKHNEIIRRRNNPDYYGQIQLRIIGVPYLSRILLAISDIIIQRQIN